MMNGPHRFPDLPADHPENCEPSQWARDRLATRQAAALKGAATPDGINPPRRFTAGGTVETSHGEATFIGHFSVEPTAEMIEALGEITKAAVERMEPNTGSGPDQ